MGFVRGWETVGKRLGDAARRGGGSVRAHVRMQAPLRGFGGGVPLESRNRRRGEEILGMGPRLERRTHGLSTGQIKEEIPAGP